MIGIIVTIIASYLSAQFANKVNNRIVGLTTGIVITVLGIFLLLLHYRAATYVDLGLPEQTNRQLYEIAKKIKGE